MYAQVFQSSSQGGSESMHLMYLLSIAAATKSIDLAMAYFVPDEITSEALVSAMKRGVRVRLILPGHHTDTDFVRNASRASWGPLLQAGALIHEYQPTMYHVKLLIVDGLWSSVGSTNFDARSFRLNDEANLNVYDADFARLQTETFDADLKQAKRITYEQWEARPWHEKLKGARSSAVFFRSYRERSGKLRRMKRYTPSSSRRSSLPSYHSACRCASASPSANVIWCRSSCA